MPEEKFETKDEPIAQAVHYIEPPQEPQIAHHDDFQPQNMDTPPPEAEPHTEENFAGEGVSPAQEDGEGGGVVPTTSA